MDGAMEEGKDNMEENSSESAAYPLLLIIFLFQTIVYKLKYELFIYI